LTALAHQVDSVDAFFTFYASNHSKTVAFTCVFDLS
jgi:hypothetical protein